MGVSENGGFSPKSSIFIGFSIINHPFWGTLIFGNTPLVNHHFSQPFGENICCLLLPSIFAANPRKNSGWVVVSCRFSESLLPLLPLIGGHTPI